MLLEVGRVCIKKYGRDAGSRAVITKLLDNGYVNIITTDRPRERKCNPNHLEFLNETINVSDKEQLNKVLGIKAETAAKNSETARKK